VSGSVNRMAKWCRRVALLCLYLFVLFLPLYEAPKNIFGFLFLAFGIISIILEFLQNRSVKIERPPYFILLFILLFFLTFFSGLGTNYLSSDQRFWSAFNWASMLLVCITYFSLKINEVETILIIRILCFSLVLGIFDAFWSWEGEYPQINSVGHVNQSALYASIVAISSFFLFVFERVNKINLSLFLVTIIMSGLYLAYSKSLVALGLFFTGLGGFLFIWLGIQKRRKEIVFLCVGVILIGVSLSKVPVKYFGVFEPVMDEFHQRLANDRGKGFSNRDLLFNSAIEVAADSVFGFGLGSFGEATTKKRLKKRVEGRGGNWKLEKNNYFSSSHGHNLFSNMLVERGWLGVVAMLGFLIGLGVYFIRNARRSRFALYGSFFLLLVCLAGFGQSVFHVEHGQVAFLVLIMLCQSIHNKFESEVGDT